MSKIEVQPNSSNTEIVRQRTAKAMLKVVREDSITLPPMVVALAVVVLVTVAVGVLALTEAACPGRHRSHHENHSKDGQPHGAAAAAAGGVTAIVGTTAAAGGGGTGVPFAAAQ